MYKPILSPWLVLVVKTIPAAGLARKKAYFWIWIEFWSNSLKLSDLKESVSDRLSCSCLPGAAPPLPPPTPPAPPAPPWVGPRNQDVGGRPVHQPGLLPAVIPASPHRTKHPLYEFHQDGDCQAEKCLSLWIQECIFFCTCNQTYWWTLNVERIFFTFSKGWKNGE